MTSIESKLPFRPVAFPAVELSLDKRDDGTILLKNSAELDVEFDLVGKEFSQTVKCNPEKVAIAERDADGNWVKVTFATLKSEVDAVAQWLVNQGANGSTPLMIVSGNSISHAVIRFAALSIGVPVSPVSENYALLGGSSDYVRLRYAAELVKPRFVFAETAAFASAADVFEDATIITREPDAFTGTVENYSELLKTPVTDDLQGVIEAVDPDAPAAILLTSGSTGKPKPVVHTNRMITAWKNILLWSLKDTEAWDDLILDWLPWSHVSGLHTCLSAMLNGTSVYLDKGKPIPGLFDATVNNIRDLKLRQFLNVPSGYQMLADAMEKDEELRDAFFKDMLVLVFAGASLPQATFDKLQKLAVESIGQRIVIVSGYGMTETTSGFMSTYYETESVGAIGLPHPGAELKLVPCEGRYELRVRGITVTPGYLNLPEANASAFDDEGYYRTGDVCEFVDAAKPEKGINFAGRLSEEFKLNNGTWVSTSLLRTDILKALSPEVFEILICGENRDYIGVLAWANPMLGSITVEDLRSKLDNFNQSNATLSRKVKRLALIAEFPDLEGGEMTDKGTVNQRLSLKLRADRVDQLYANVVTDDVLRLD